jgi:ABC-type branched-subunit amino acid transport system permease subunit
MSDARNLWSSRLRTDFRAALLVVVGLAVVPLFVTSPYWLGVLVVSMYFALIALGWNLLAGFTGQFSLAPAAFAMLGAYATALLAYHLKAPLAVGIPAGDRSTYPASAARRKEVSLQLVRRMEAPDLGRAVALVAVGRASLAGLVSHRFDLEEAPQAFEVLASRAGLKVVVQPAAGS